jgi:hypothetical protein
MRCRHGTSRVTTEPNDVLEQAIATWIARGYQVQMRGPTYAQLMKPKRFSVVWALLWFLLFGFGLLIYIVYFLAKSQPTVYLSVDTAGRLTQSRS